MRARRAPARGLAALFLLCLLLASAVALAVRHPDSLVLRLQAPTDGTLADPGSAAGDGIGPGPFRPPGANAFLVIEQRPLFAATRRPPETDTPEPDGPEPAPLLEGLALTGIIGASGSRIAIVEGSSRSGESPISLRVGDTIRGWTLEAIEEERIILVKGDERHVLELVLDRQRNPHGAANGQLRDRKSRGQLQPQQPQPPDRR